MIRLVILLVLLVLPQGPQASIEGTVVYASTGAPVAMVSLELTGIEGAKVMSRTATTTDKGEFSFRGLPPGTGYQLVARGPGIVSTAYGQRDSRDPWKPIDLAPGQQLRDVRITVHGLTHLSGKILDASGRPLAGVQVLAMRPSYVDGRRELQSAGAAYTDMRGEYRFSGLLPGVYYIRVSPQIDIPELFINPAAYDRAPDTREREKISREPEGYRMVYYPGGPIESARALLLEEGRPQDGIDITMTKSRTGRVRGAVIDAATSRRIATAQVMLLPSGSAADSNWSRYTVSKDGAFDFRAVQPGMYYLNATVTGVDITLAGRSLVEIRPGDNVVPDLRVSPAVDIRGRIVMEDPAAGVPDFSALTIQLAADLSGPIDASLSRYPITLPSATADVGRDGTFTLRNVLPSDYQVNVTKIQGAYIKSIRFGTEDVVDKGSHVEGGKDSALEIVLGTNTGSLDGRVLDSNHNNVAAARVVLAPENGLRRDLYAAITSSNTGRFQLSGIAPGRYRLYAWKRVPEGAWTDPDFLDRYKDRGSVVDLRSGAAEYLEIDVIPE